MAITIPLILFNGVIDDFSPKHIAFIQESSYLGKLSGPTGPLTSFPGFYGFGSLITLLAGIDAEKLLAFPIQVVPHSILLFSLLYLLSSKSIILSSVITFITLITGTAAKFFDAHNMGLILFLCEIMIIFIILQRDQHPKSFILIGFITGSTLSYLSYNYNSMILILLSTIIIIFTFLLFKYDFNEGGKMKCSKYLKLFIPLLLVLCLVTFGLNQFVFRTYLPTMESTPQLDFSSMDKFITSYIDPESINTIFSELSISYPKTITLINMIKYGILLLSIFIFCIYFVKKLLISKSFNIVDLLVLTILSTFIIYSGLKYLIDVGASFLTLIYIPAILCLTRIYQISNKQKQWVFFVLIVIFLCTILNYSILYDNNYINKDEFQFSSYKSPVDWYIRTNIDYLAVSDEYTKNFFILNLIIKSTNDDTWNSNIYKNIKIIPKQDIPMLLNSSDGPLENRYYILNNRLTEMSLENWIIIKSWSYSENKINGNNKINKIYTAPILSIYSYSSS